MAVTAENADAPRRVVAVLPARAECRPAGIGFPAGLFVHARGRFLILSVSLFLVAAVASAALNAAGLDWQPGVGFRYAALQVANEGKPGLTLMSAPGTGIEFTNHLSRERGQTNMVLWNGSGVAAGDVDGDGLCDLYFCNLDGPNALFRNLGGWKFTNIAAEAGVACPGQQSTGAVFADVDGDGHLDLLVSSIGHGVRLFINDGKGHFRETTAGAGLFANTGSMTLALADIDGDGALDLYVANYRKDTLQDQPNMRFTLAMNGGKPTIMKVDGQPVTPDITNRYAIGDGGTVIEYGEPDVLYRNDRHGKFSPVSWTDGSFLDEDGHPLSAPPADWGLSAMFRDLNGDGAPDLYVCNDTYSPDRIWLNLGQGRFRALPRLALRQTSYSSMGVDFADLNRDGLDEILLTDMLSREHTNRNTQLIMRRPLGMPGNIENRPDYQRNTLFLNRGDGTYAEIAQFSGIDATDWTWSPVFLDVDLDGYEDLLITTGHAWNLLYLDTRMRVDTLRRRTSLSLAQFYELRSMYKPFDCPNYAFRNRGDLTFEDQSAGWGFDSRQISQGMCLADLDNDGDLDVIVNCFNQPALVYRNNCTAPRVAVRLRGKPGNTRGVGASIKVLGGPVPQSQQMICGGRYVSSDDFIRAFAAGSGTNPLTIEVRWRSGLVSTVTNALANAVYEIEEAGAAPAPTRPAQPLPEPCFRDASHQLAHVHHEEPFDDFAVQPSLTRRLAPFGPGVSWFDFDGDGVEDLIIGSARGGALGIFRNLGHGDFEPFRLAGLGTSSPDDEAAVLGVSALGTSMLLVARSRYKAGDTNGILCYEVNAQGVALRERLPTGTASAGPLAMADVDGDGALDLFVGGRVVPGHYPAPAASFLYLNRNGRFQLDETNASVLRQIGLVNSAVFSDLNGDGAPDLVLGCEWGPIRVFRNEHGKLVPWNPPLTFGGPAVSGGPRSATLNELTGWWQGVAAGDFDGDGRMDIVATGWGSNGRYQRYLGHPLRIFYEPEAADGPTGFLEAYYDDGLGKWVPWQRLPRVAAVFPFIQERVHSFEQFSRMGIDEILGDAFSRMTSLSANTMQSVVLLNRGDHLEARFLPFEAQLAPAFGVSVGDLDGDGSEDLFLSQNFFAVDPETSRYDAGRGVWLRGDGHGGFQAVPGQKSGLLIYGEGRGAALCDYDADGRVDLVVAQNGTTTKLYHNECARPGLRVRLSGLPGNPQAIGARLRLGDGRRLGPAREVHLGAGWLSQDSAVQVMAAGFDPCEVRVCWPDGKQTISPIPARAREIAVDFNGKVTLMY